MQLSLTACKLTGEAVAPVAEIIGFSEELEEVDLSWNPVRR